MVRWGREERRLRRIVRDDVCDFLMVNVLSFGLGDGGSVDKARLSLARLVFSVDSSSRLGAILTRAMRSM